jgi:hypothetical protein
MPSDLHPAPAQFVTILGGVGDWLKEALGTLEVSRVTTRAILKSLDGHQRQHSRLP